MEPVFAYAFGKATGSVLGFFGFFVAPVSSTTLSVAVSPLTSPVIALWQNFGVS